MPRTPARVAALLLVARPLAAQDAGPPRSPVSLDATFGLGRGLGGGDRRERTLLALDATLAARVRSIARGSVVVALAGGTHFSPIGADDCLVVPGGGCLPDFPAFHGLGVLAGTERGAPRGRTVRFLAGPTFYAVDGGGGAVGVQGRMDLAAGTVARLAPLLSLRAAVIPRGRGSTYGLVAGGVGLRLH